MKLRYLIVGGIGFIVGWNLFLIQRDQKMFDAHHNNLTPKEQFCKQQAGWHPDCNVE